MPYRHAHWYLLALFPPLVLAFWPTYFAIFSSSSAVLHAHAAAGTVWIAILAAQSWLIRHGWRYVHRQTGIASLAVFPFFMATSAAVVVLMAQDFASQSSPFGVTYEPRLGLGSIILVSGFAYCYWQGLRWRRKVHQHSRYVLATVLFLLPPIFSRLSRFVPFLEVQGPQDRWKFAIVIQIANGLVAAAAFFLAWRAGKHGRPFVDAGAVSVLVLILVPTLGVAVWWGHFYAQLASIPVPAATLAGGIAGTVIAYSGWIAGKRTTPQVETVPA